MVRIDARRRAAPVPAALAAVLALLVGVLGLSADGTGAQTPTAQTPTAQTPPALDSVRLLADLAVLAHDSMRGRAAGTPGSERAARFLERALAETGARPAPGGYRQEFRWPRGSGVNLVGIVPGTVDQDGVIVLTAHYDHLGVRDGEIYNGADDNASGSAAVLELTRAAVAAPLRHTLVVALLDAEEEGFWGAKAFLDDPPVPLESIVLNVNLDMVSRTGGVLWASGASHTPALRPVLERLAQGAPLTLRLGHDRPGAPEGDDWTEASDHAVFFEAGIPFVYFGVEDHVDYHEPTDDFERIDPGELLAAVRTIQVGLRALDRDPPLPAGAQR
ncbi:MAG TPA: M28 family peptidase [Longimicrobiales bacterium]|nr:M28 family peptidase [Longimicrobiales bacterium]